MKDLIGTSFETAARAVFGALCDHANSNAEVWPPWVPRADQGYAAWPSVRRIAAITNLGERGVQTALRQLENGGAIRSIYRSAGGAPKRCGEKTLPGRTSCYLITPHSVQGSEYAGPVPQPRSDFGKTPHSALDNPATEAPDNPAFTAPKGFSHHHQEDRSRGTSAERNWKTFSKMSEDEGAGKRASIDGDPLAEFAERLKERSWLAGPIADVHSIVQIVADGLKYDRTTFSEFLAYEATQTTAGKIKSPAAHYRSLVPRFYAARAQRQRAAIINLQRDRQRKRDPTPETCSMRNPDCNGRGELYRDGIPVGICQCEAGQRLSPKVKADMEAINPAAFAARG